MSAHHSNYFRVTRAPFFTEIIFTN